jgi:hypothetical protein
VSSKKACLDFATCFHRCGRRYGEMAVLSLKTGSLI